MNRIEDSALINADTAQAAAIATLMDRHPGMGNQLAWLNALDKAVAENPAIGAEKIIRYWIRLSDANRLTAVMNPLLGLVLEENRCHM